MLPPTSALALAGMGAGAGLGHGLGSIFDSPRQALTNLALTPFAHSQIAAANGKDDNFNWSSMLPGAAGLAAGGIAALMPGMAPFAPAIGAGVAGLGQAVGDYFDPKTFDAPTTGELTRTLGVDPDTMGGQALGMGIGALTDPMTYAGGFEGMMGGQAVGGARDALAERAAQMGQVADRATGLMDLAGQAETAVHNFEGSSPNAALLGQFDRDQQRSLAGYRPEVMQALDHVDPLAPMSDKLYKQADPGMSQDLDLLGLGTPQGKGVSLATGKAPPWAESRGGWLKPTHARESMLGGEDVLAHPSVVGPDLDRAAGYEGLLQDPMKDFVDMRGGADGLGELRTPARKVPSFASALGADAGSALYDNPLARIDDFPVQPMMAKDPTAYVQGNVGSLPLYDARDRINSMLSEALSQRDALAGMEPTRLQAMLQRLGLAPR